MAAIESPVVGTQTKTVIKGTAYSYIGSDDTRIHCRLQPQQIIHVKLINNAAALNKI